MKRYQIVNRPEDGLELRQLDETARHINELWARLTEFGDEFKKTSDTLAQAAGSLAGRVTVLENPPVPAEPPVVGEITPPVPTVTATAAGGFIAVTAYTSDPVDSYDCQLQEEDVEDPPTDWQNTKSGTFTFVPPLPNTNYIAWARSRRAYLQSEWAQSEVVNSGYLPYLLLDASNDPLTGTLEISLPPQPGRSFLESPALSIRYTYDLTTYDLFKIWDNSGGLGTGPWLSLGLWSMGTVWPPTMPQFGYFNVDYGPTIGGAVSATLETTGSDGVQEGRINFYDNSKAFITKDGDCYFQHGIFDNSLAISATDAYDQALLLNAYDGKNSADFYSNAGGLPVKWAELNLQQFAFDWASISGYWIGDLTGTDGFYFGIDYVGMISDKTDCGIDPEYFWAWGDNGGVQVEFNETANPLFEVYGDGFMGHSESLSIQIRAIDGGALILHHNDSTGPNTIFFTAALDCGFTNNGNVFATQATFSPSVTAPPIFIGDNGRNQLVSYLNSDLLDGYHASAFALAGHNHDSAYISIVGTPTAGNLPALTAGGELTDSGSKPADFAAVGHNHDGTYATAGHNHDSAYISIVGTPTAGNLPALTAGGELTDSGSKPADFAAVGHNHDGTYATAGHNHDSAYISIVGTPTAGNLPALTAGGELTDSGSKPADFATASHNHSGVYDPAGTAATAITNHEAAADPHASYQKESEKGAASGYASLNASTLVVENPANAQATPAASKIPLADGTGKIATGWTPAMTGATSGDAGAAGLVPAPAAGDQDKVLSGAGTWITPASGGGDSVSVNGTACTDADLDDDGVTADAGRALMEWKTSGSSPTKINCQTPASVPVVLDREINTTIGTSWTAALTHEIPAGAMGTTRMLRFTLTGYYQNYSGSSQNMYIRVKFGGTTMMAATLVMGKSSSTYRAFTAQGWIANANATNAQRAGMVVTYTTNTNNPTTGYGGVGTTGFAHGALRGTAAEYTDSAVTLEVALYRANASNVSLIIDHAVLELV